MNGREMFWQTSAKQANAQQKLGNRTNRWSKVQADARCPSSKGNYAKDNVDLKTTYYSTYEFAGI